MKELHEPFSGVFCSLTDAIKITVEQILKLDIPTIETGKELKFFIKYGYDGSGGHKVFNQSGNMDTNSIIMVMFCPLKLQQDDQTIWEQICPNSEFSQRPLMLQLGKESTTNCQSLSMFETELKDMNGAGLVLDGTGVVCKVEVQATALDRKASNIYLSLGGAYCDLCTLSKTDCCDEEKIKEGFLIDRNIETMESIFNSLEEDGEIVKKANDYSYRQGQTNKPIAKSSVTSVQVLHGLLRSFDHWMKVVVHLGAGVLSWSESKVKQSTQFLEAQKQLLQKTISDCSGIK